MKTLVVPTIHPTFVLRGEERLLAVLGADLDRARRLSETGYHPTNREIRVLPKSPDLDEALQILKSWYTDGASVAIDTETTGLDPLACGLRSLAVSAYGSSVGIAIPFNAVMDRDYMKTRSDMCKVVRAMCASETIQKIFHNANFDMPILDRHGFPVYGPIQDTIIIHHVLEPDLEHNLGFCAQLYLDVEPWKLMFRELEKKKVSTLDDLLKYNCLMAGTPVLLSDGSTRSVEVVVRGKQPISVLSLSGDGAITSARVVGWHRVRVPNQRWTQIKLATTYGGASRGLILTPDHKVLTARGMIAAAEVTTADSIATAEVLFTKEQRQALLGTLLGDSSLLKTPSRRAGGRGGLYIAGSHAVGSGYPEHKVAVLEPNLRLHRRQAPGKTAFPNAKDRQPFGSGILYQTEGLLELLYDPDERTRRLRREVLDELGPIGLAWWFMDDGCLQKGQRIPLATGARGGRLVGRDSVTIAACRYPQTDVDAAVDWLRDRYGACFAGKDRVIRLSAKASERFCTEISPHVIPGLRYKLIRDVELPAFRSPATAGGPREPVFVPVEFSGDYQPRVGTKEERLIAETRYCLTVDETHNFFTSFGLVANCLDAVTTQQLFGRLLQEAADRGNCEPVIQAETRWSLLAGRMERTGVPIHEPTRLKLKQDLEAKRDGALSKIIEATGRPDLNLNKPKDRKFLLYDFLKLPVRKYTKKTLQPATSYKGVLDSLSTPLVPEFITWAEVSRDIGTFITGYGKRVKTDGRLHPSWNCAGQVGSRMTSSPNLQNVPVGVRKMIRAPTGKVLIYADQAQLEYRIIACLSGAKRLLEIFADPTRDAHTEMCWYIFGKERFVALPPDKQESLRTIVKRVVYALGYGAEPPKITFSLREDRRMPLDVRALVTLHRIEEIKAGFFKANPEIHVWREGMLDFVNRHGFLEIPPLGRRRYFPMPAERNKVFNWPVQTMGSDIVNEALTEIDEALPSGGLTLINGHDAGLWECWRKDAEAVVALVEEKMFYTLNGPAGPVNLVAKAKIMDAWGKG